MPASKTEFARLVCLTGETVDTGERVAIDPTTGLIQPSLETLLAQLSQMENKCGLAHDAMLTPMQRVARLEAFVENSKTLSAKGKPARPVRWTDGQGKVRVDLGAIFDLEAAAANGGAA